MELSFQKTSFYSDCLGVFQGGGCRAAAFAGALAEGYKLGVRFSEVAGTSAGSIIAALIAAGVEAEELVQRVRALHFPSLLAPTRRALFSDYGFRPRFAIRILWRNELRKVLHGGLHSSERVGAWVEEALSEALGIGGRPVFFSDLLMPLHVVASDLSAMRPRVWSTDLTPNESVSHAVRCSCTMPIFFQPVEEGTTLLVDGGLVSNMPVFVYGGHQAHDRQPNQRILVFSLESSRERNQPSRPWDYIAQLITTSIEGTTDVQLRLAPEVARVVIPTGDVSATDFDKMNEQTTDLLIQNGRHAVSCFLKNEAVSARIATWSRRPIYDEHDAFLRVTERIYAPRDRVLVSFTNTRWFWELFPTVFFWLRTGVRLVCICQPISMAGINEKKEVQRRDTLRAMGATIVERSSPPFEGFLFDFPGDSTAVAIAYSSGEVNDGAFAQLFEGKSDRTIIAALHETLKFDSANTETSHKISLERCAAKETLHLLKSNVRQYRDPKTMLELCQVPIKDVMLMSHFVRAFRYRQVESLVSAYKESDLKLFETACVRLGDGKYSIVTPPVLESCGDAFVALEGNTRCLYCLNNGISEILAIVARNVVDALPAEPVPLRHVRITSYKRRPEERMNQFNISLFRDIERAVRPIE